MSEPSENTATIDQIDVQGVISRIAAGEYQSHIAQELGLPKQILHQRVSKHPDYREALLARNIGKLDHAQAAIEGEKGNPMADDLARAREAFKAAAWRAERECRAEYGQAPTVAIQINEYAARPTEDLLAELRGLLDK